MVSKDDDTSIELEVFIKNGETHPLDVAITEISNKLADLRAIEQAGKRSQRHQRQYFYLNGIKNILNDELLNDEEKHIEIIHLYERAMQEDVFSDEIKHMLNRIFGEVFLTLGITEEKTLPTPTTYMSAIKKLTKEIDKLEKVKHKRGLKKTQEKQLNYFRRMHEILHDDFRTDEEKKYGILETYKDAEENKVFSKRQQVMLARTFGTLITTQQTWRRAVDTVAELRAALRKDITEYSKKTSAPNTKRSDPRVFAMTYLTIMQERLTDQKKSSHESLEEARDVLRRAKEIDGVLTKDQLSQLEKTLGPSEKVLDEKLDIELRRDLSKIYVHLKNLRTHIDSHKSENKEAKLEAIDSMLENFWKINFSCKGTLDDMTLAFNNEVKPLQKDPTTHPILNIIEPTFPRSPQGIPYILFAEGPNSVMIFFRRSVRFVINCLIGSRMFC